MAEPGVTKRLAAAGAAYANPPPDGTIPATPSGLDAPSARAPLVGQLGPMGGPVTFEERAFVGKLNLRGNPDNSSFMTAAAKALGTSLPTQPLTFIEKDGMRIHWVGPDHWMIHVPEGAEGPLRTKLQKAFKGIHAAVTDVSDYYTLIRVTGLKARALLQKGCPLDLHPRAFTPGTCAGTVFHHAAIFITQTEANEDNSATYDIQIRWSFAQYMWDYFTDGAREWAAG